MQLSTQAYSTKSINQRFSWKSWDGLLYVSLIIAAACHVFMSLYAVPLSGHDTHVHLDWIEQFIFLRRGGIAMPHWLPWSFGGFGSTAFYFYPPLTFYLADAISLLTTVRDPTRLFHLLQLLSVVLTLLGTYFYVRFNGVEKRRALAAAGIAAIGPYHLWDIYLRCALPEQMAFSFVPLILLAIDYSVSADKVYRHKAVVLSAIAWSTLILTNIPTTVILLMTAPVYAIARAWNRDQDFKQMLQRLSPAIFGAALGAALAAFYLLPVAHFQKFIATEHLFDNYIPGLRWTFTLQELFRSDIAKNAKHLLIPLTLVSSAVLLVYFWRNFKSNQNRPFARAWFFVTLLATAIQIPFIMEPVWNLFTPLHLVQFSWRWCLVLVFVPAMAYAIMSKASHTRQTAYLIMITVLMVVNAVWYARYLFIVMTYPLPPAMVSAARMGVPEHLPKTAFFSDQAVTMHFGESHMFDPPASIVSPQPTTDSIQLVNDGYNSKSYSANLQDSAEVIFHVYYWPQWRAVANGKQIALHPDAHGIVAATLLPGHYNVTLYLAESDEERIGKLISLLAAAVLIGVCVAGFRSERQTA